MKREVIPITTEADWLVRRQRDVTSTEVSALFGLSPYLTEFELFHRKRANEPVVLAENERMRWGKRLEAVIAHGVASDEGWSVSHADYYARIPDLRMGSSFDYEVRSKQFPQGIEVDVVGLMEVKNVDGLQFRNKWLDQGDTLEAPEHIELQIQHQMEVANRDYCILVALVGGNHVRWVKRNRDRTIGAQICERVAEFWNAIDKNEAPSPDYSRDADFIVKSIHNSARDGEVVQADAELEDLIQHYAFLKREADGADHLCNMAKARLLERIGTASKIVSVLGSISCGMVKDNPGTLITPEMVGTHVGGRKGYRSFRYNPKKEN
jgi:predicted phage-related endonuclease